MKRLLLSAAIVSSIWAASTASAQYFGPRLGFPGRSVFAAPIVLPPPPMAFYYGPRIGAIPRWSRAMPIPPVPPAYPTTSYVPRPFSLNITPTEIDIRTPGFEYRAERGFIPESIPGFRSPPSYPNTGSLTEAAYRLAAALSSRSDGEIWLEYLQPERVAESSDPGELAELILRYRGVMSNPDLAWLADEDGFQQVLQQLSAISRESDAAAMESPSAAPIDKQTPAPVETPTKEIPPATKPRVEAEELPAPKAEPTTSV